MKRLVARTALVTGAGQGIGAAIALRLASEGANVAVTDINHGTGEAAAEAIRASGGRASFVPLNVTEEQQWREAISAVVAEFGGLGILVNNAGIGDPNTIEDCTLENYETTIAVTQTSVFLGMKLAADLLKASGHGAIVNISSIMGASGGFGSSPAYHAAKGAVRILTKNAALLWATEGIRVNSVHPGFIATPMMDQIRGTDTEAAIFDVTPMGRLGLPEEVAAGVAYLASDDAAFCTGSELYIDGGYLAR